MNIQQYIESGVIETYVLGLATPEEASQLERLLPFYPDLQNAITDFSFQLELFAIQNEEPPPPDVFRKIEDRVRELPAVKTSPSRIYNGKSARSKQDDGYVHVRESSTHIRVHKYWRAAFVVIFALSKILLVGTIYYFLQYQHASKDLRALQDQQVKTNKSSLPSESQDNDK